MTIDLQQFHQVFFEESLEGLDIMEQGLLTLGDGGDEDIEVINNIFRAAHSIKGGSGTFGFSEIADFTHILETLLDEARDGKRVLDTEAVDLLLKAADCLRSMVNSLQLGEKIDDSSSKHLAVAFEAMLAGVPVPQGEETQSAVPAPAILSVGSVESDLKNTAPDSAHQQQSHQDILADCFDTMLNGGDAADGIEDGRVDTPPPAAKQWKIVFQPEVQILLTGNEPLRLFRELEAMGQLRVEADTSRVPSFDRLTTDECFIHWVLWLSADVSHDDIAEVFDWVMDECKLSIEEVGDVAADAAIGAVTSEHVDDFVAENPKLEPDASPTSAEKTPVPEVSPAKLTAPQTVKPTAKSSSDTSVANTSIRVGIDKVDSLINLVGELVITQSMLSELGNDFDMNKLERLATGLEQLQQNTRELQESVMRIRMLPISFAFNRFPRMIRDLSAKIGKKVELKLSGENTELDKTVMEQIGDPLVHLVRNAIDHGLEMPEQRLAAGKDETGTISLDAYHKGGNIVVEIKDDGQGIDPDVILAKAIEKGVASEGQLLSEQEIFELIFEPGFSTAAVVSDISGRGVGMDVVRRNIKSLGGRIEINSKLGEGSTFKVHLPLTLAILDGQLVKVGSEVYIVPLVAIVESLQIKPELVNKVSGNMVLYRLREDNVPIIPIYDIFGIEAENTQLEDGLLVVVEGEGQKIGLLVDDLLAQQQVVIKSLESNYKRVEGISGATILGDGSVSMILDIPGLIRRATDNNGRGIAKKQHQAA